MRAIYEPDQTQELPEDWQSDHSGFAPMRIFRDDSGDSGDTSPRTTASLNNAARLRKAVGTNFRGSPVLRATLANTGRRNFAEPVKPSPCVAADGLASPVPPPPMTEAQEPSASVATVASIVAEVLRQTGTLDAHRREHPVRTEEPQKPGSFQTLREFYRSTLSDERNRRISTGRNKAGTAQKDLAALSFWERLSGNPGLSDMSAAIVQEFIGKAIAAGRRSTAAGYCGHLRWMLNEAKRAGLVADVPVFSFPKVSRRSGMSEQHRETLIYEINGDILGTLGKIHNAIECPELRLAFICGASFGPRTEDLLTLKWSDFDLTAERPVVRYVAEKTGTFHVVPLAPFLVRKLQVHQSDSEWLFPSLISVDSAVPSKSRACRRTVSTLRTAAAEIGFDFSQGGRHKAAEQKPFQILRATCNERFERHHARAGEWILGHSMTSLNRKSYQQPGGEIFQAVQSLIQPAAFLSFDQQG